MKKYSLLALAVALLFAMTMVAQTGGSSYPSSPSSGTQVGQQPGSSGAQTGTPDYGGSPSTMGSQSQTGSMGAQTSAESSTGMNKPGKEKTVEGCIVQQQDTYYIFPKKGHPMRISGPQVSQHVGHEVKLHGQRENASSASAAYGNTGGTSGAATGETAEAGASTGEPGSASSASGNMGATAGSNPAMGASNKEFVVDRVDMVSETCPANIQNRINKSGMGSGSTGETQGQGSTMGTTGNVTGSPSGATSGTGASGNQTPPPQR